MVSPVLYHTWLQQSFQIYKYEDGKQENCSIAKFDFLLSPLHSPRSAETDEERPIPHR